jgi:hypothetical protein
VIVERWFLEIEREVEQLSRAPFFVLNPEALLDVGDELRRIRSGSGRDHELEEDDYDWAIIDNARHLDAKLAEARRQLDEREFADVEWFTRQRLFAIKPLPVNLARPARRSGSSATATAAPDRLRWRLPGRSWLRSPSGITANLTSRSTNALLTVSPYPRWYAVSPTS